MLDLCVAVSDDGKSSENHRASADPAPLDSRVRVIDETSQEDDVNESAIFNERVVDVTEEVTTAERRRRRRSRPIELPVLC